MLYTHKYLLNPTHRINVVLVGVGGTGSFVLPELVALSKSLEMLDRKPFKIHVFDDDVIEEHNVGRQKFFPTDIGKHKAEVLTNRVNRAFSTDVEFYNRKVLVSDMVGANIVITCVDNVSTRKKLSKNLRNKSCGNSYQQTYYWIDCGNSRDYGQIIMAAYSRKKRENQSSIIELHPDMKDVPTEPSCSLRASLMEQSFMINKLTGVYALEILASLFLDFNITYSQVYFSLAPINVKTNKI